MQNKWRELRPYWTCWHRDRTQIILIHLIFLIKSPILQPRIIATLVANLQSHDPLAQRIHQVNHKLCVFPTDILPTIKSKAF